MPRSIKKQAKLNVMEKKPRAIVLKNIKYSEDYENIEKWSKIIRKGLKYSKPFPYWQFNNFIENSDHAVEDIEKELQNFPSWHRKENDLYSLYQTDDLKSLDITNFPSLFALRQFIYGPVKKWLSTVTGVELLSQVDINGSCYSYTDGLLPHNDLIDTRRFAFVYYTTPHIWEKSYGGELNLYDSNEYDQPTAIAAQLLPQRNSFLVFEVTHKSWHRVNEIIQNEAPRLSVNGWFHSNRILSMKSAHLLQQPTIKQRKKKCMDPSSLINSVYLEADKKMQIQEVFGNNSEISLKNFIKMDLLHDIIRELNNGKYSTVGPPNKRCVRHGKLEELGELSMNLEGFLKSTTASSYFSSITNCDLQNCPISLTLLKVEHGSYTVLGDEDAEKAKRDGYSLEAHIFFSEKSWPTKSGGDTIYVGKDDEEPLITIHPEQNMLALVLRDPDVFSFLKYANVSSPGAFYQITLVYHNIPVEVSDAE